MFYQILLFMPLKLWSGPFFLIFLQSRSLVSGHVCFRTPPEGSEPADPDINRSIKKQARAIVFFPQQSDKWREDAEPKGSAE